MDLTEPLKFEQQKVTKLSQAIREGARLRPKCVGEFFKDGKSCVLGAAYEATIGPYEECKSFKSHYMRLAERFPFLKGTIPGTYSPLGTSLYSDNDDGITREAIADRLESMGY